MDTLAVAQTSVQALSIVQRVSASTFSTFLIVHLSAPVLAALAPRGLGQAERQASGMMVLGRVWYQGEWSEGVVVWGSLAVHVASGMLLRLARSVERRERRKRRRYQVHRDASLHVAEEEELQTYPCERSGAPTSDETFEDTSTPSTEDSTTPISSEPTPIVAKTSTSYISTLLGPFNWTHLTGYVLVPIVLKHLIAHRLLPSSPSIALSPTLFSYSYVSYGLSDPARRVQSWVAYSVITAVGSYHALSGMRTMINPTAPRGLGPCRGKEVKSLKDEVTRRGWQVGYGTLLMGVGIGLARLAADGPAVPQWMANRYSKL